jgi:hypothetical protein
MSDSNSRLDRRTFLKDSVILSAALTEAAGLGVSGTVALAGVDTNQPESSKEKSWTFVSSPDFFNFDIPNPWPQYDDAVNWYLWQLKKENPDFALITGDLVNGHWWDGPKCIEHMGAIFYENWISRLREHDLKYYVAVGDHELGDDPWPKNKIELIPHFERVFSQHLQMPNNGPPGKKGLAYYVLHKNTLLITVETFEVKDGEMRLDVIGEQMEWFKDVLAKHKDADHIIVQGHIGIIGKPKSRSSSGLMLEGGKDSEFWKVMKEAGVDMYLCGEFHAVTVSELDGIWHIVHGSSWGRKVVDTQDYLVCKVTPDSINLEMKSFPMYAKGDNMWNLHKDKGPQDIVDIPQEVREKGPQVIGTLTIKKTTDGKQFLNRSGVFQ